MKLILASNSPRRRELIKKLNIPFKSINPGVDESAFNIKFKKPHTYCMASAKLKSWHIRNKFKNDLLISADTIVCLNGKIIEKPANHEEAFKFLKKLSNKKHSVYTGVSILSSKKNLNICFYEKTDVFFHLLNDEDINYYINNFNVLDKAGAYGIQDWSCIFAKKINGCFYNVIGLPISKIYKTFKNNNIKLVNFER